MSLTLDVSKLLEDLTEPQREAVTHVDGPLLVLAAAGSGKTRVITRRVGYLMSQGIDPYRILAITFTNKAAGEMRQRIATLTAEPGDPEPRPPRGLTVCTFHSLCARLLRQYAEPLGISPNFTIYDQADTARCIKRIIEADQRSTGHFQPGAIASAISNAKNRLQNAEQFADSANDFFKKAAARYFEAYQQALAESQAMDFDDLLVRTTLALRDRPEIRQAVQDRFIYLLIDEYQDTNHAQYVMSKLIGERSQNFCATGDPDQSIYGWRGADLNNILQFEKDFPSARVVRLEQNYRSTKVILRAADALIQRNRKRKHKRLWTENDEGAPIDVVRCGDQEAEAACVAERVAALLAGGAQPSQVAVFYRINALSRAVEDALRRKRVPYQIIRGVAFYQRKEIKDLLAYAIAVVNPDDRLAVERIINTPPRGIGNTTLERIAAFAEQRQITLPEAIGQVEQLPLDGRSAKAVAAFAQKLADWRGRLAHAAAAVAIQTLAEESGYSDMLARTDDAEGSARRNVDELITAAKLFDEESGDGNLRDFLEQAALVSDQDALDETAGRVSLMTMHAAKGLEFPHVFIVGLEDGLIPHRREDKPESRDVEEERRLLFVGITRAKRQLTLTLANERSLHGMKQLTIESPFLRELDPEAIRRIDNVGRDAAQEQDRLAQRRAAVKRPSPEVRAPRMSEVYDGLQLGRRVLHKTYGMGRVANLSGAKTGSDDNRRATVKFEGVGEKTIYLRFGKLQLL